jgi:hypothetical protein
MGPWQAYRNHAAFVELLSRIAQTRYNVAADRIPYLLLYFLRAPYG